MPFREEKKVETPHQPTSDNINNALNEFMVILYKGLSIEVPPSVILDVSFVQV